MRVGLTHGFWIFLGCLAFADVHHGSIAFAATGCASPPGAREIGFDPALPQWRVEQGPGGSVRVEDGALVIDDANGCTVWLLEKLTAPVEISCDVTVVAKGGANDRVSDVNCFWMASEPGSGAPPAPLTSGWFGFRTIKSHLEIRRLRVQAAEWRLAVGESASP